MRPTAASTRSGFWLVVPPRTPATLGPKIELALAMCLGLIGQFLIELLHTILRNWMSVGWPPLTNKKCFEKHIILIVLGRGTPKFLFERKTLNCFTLHFMLRVQF